MDQQANDKGGLEPPVVLAYELVKLTIIEYIYQLFTTICLFVVVSLDDKAS